MEVNGAPHSSEYLPLCSAEQRPIHTGLELLEGE